MSVVKRTTKGGKTRIKSKYHGLLELDKKLEEFIDYDGGYFIEIGGWDGVTYSNSLYFEQSRSWRGMLIEPAPNEYLKCRANRPNCSVFCYACVPFEYTEKFLPMTYCASMTIAHSHGEIENEIEDIEKHVISGKKFLSPDDYPYEFGALAKPLSVILDEAKVLNDIDLLILDVEGYELHVLKGIDFARHGPRFICIEVWDMSVVSEFLIDKGYFLLSVLSDQGEHKDCLFAKNADQFLN